MAPKDTPSLIPGMCDYVRLHGKGELKLQIQLELRINRL